MIVSTKYGNICGIEQDYCTVYKGVPYAKPPIGTLRFQRPQKPQPWKGVYNADHFRPKSIQRKPVEGDFYTKEFYSNPEFMTESNEDCLYLNLWVPKQKRNEKFPVAIWIHGGAFLGGAGSNLPFDGQAYAKRGIILVTINYRLGFFGFFCHPLLLENSPDNCCGNYGLWDQVAALSWVRENIEAFHGDRNNITLFGQSAGAMSLQLLAVSPVTEGKYQHMILQSGGGYDNPFLKFPDMEEAGKKGEAVLEALGISGKSWKLSDLEKQRALKLLYNTSAEELTEAVGPVIARAFQTHSGIPFLPVIDGELVPGDCNERIEDGKYHEVNYILGSNSEDMAVSMETTRKAETSILHRANVSFAQRVNRNKNSSAYVYYFSRQMPGDDSGAFHSAELWYMFGTIQDCWRPMTAADQTLSARMMDDWSRFICTGNPNEPGSLAWEVCTEENPAYMVYTI